LKRVEERTLWSEAGLNFLNYVDPEIRRAATAWFSQLSVDDPVRLQQGYLLLTVGEVSAA